MKLKMLLTLDAFSMKKMYQPTHSFASVMNSIIPASQMPRNGNQTETMSKVTEVLEESLDSPVVPSGSEESLQF